MLDNPEPSSSSPKSPKDKAAERAPKATPKGQQQENGAAGEGRVAGTGKQGNLTETEGRSTGTRLMCVAISAVDCILRSASLSGPGPAPGPALALPLPCPCPLPYPHKPYFIPDPNRTVNLADLACIYNLPHLHLLL